jgi:inner membrane protein
MLPDIDVLLRTSDPFAEWRWHRGPTHGLVPLLLLGTLCGSWLARRRGEPLGVWLPLAVASLISHPLLDLCTSYGTQLLAPFSHRRFALDWVAIVDPAYSLILVAGLWAGARARGVAAVARRAGWLAVALSTLYLVLGGFVNARIEAIARADLRARGIAPASVHAFPTLLQLPFRRIVARSGDEVRVGWLSLLRRRPIPWEGFTQASGPLVAAARATPAGRTFEWFAMGESTPRVESVDTGYLVEFDDLRYGFPGTPREGFWGVRVGLDGAGRPHGARARVVRPLPAPVSRLVYTLWRETLGWS